jgi:hypothetical protein
VDEPAAPPSDDETALLMSLVRSRYGDRLTPAQLHDVEQGVRAITAAARALRAARLDPSDEPFPPFSPLRSDP